MNDQVYVAFVILVAVVQLLLCWKARHKVVRLIPIFVLGGLIIACMVAYALGGGTNWAFLILILLLAGLLGTAGVVWALFAVLSSIAKRARG